VTSLGSNASSPYKSLNGVKPVVLEVVVLWDHTTFSNSSTHLPLQKLNRVFDITKNITLLALSTTPFDSGCRPKRRLSWCLYSCRIL